MKVDLPWGKLGILSGADEWFRNHWLQLAAGPVPLYGASGTVAAQALFSLGEDPCGHRESRSPQTRRDSVPAVNNVLRLHREVKP